MQRSFMLSISAGAIMLSISAGAMLFLSNAPAGALTVADLSGRYAYIETVECLRATGGFDALQQVIGTASGTSFSEEGVATFNGNGTGTLTAQGTIIQTFGTLVPAASSSQVSSSFSYAVAGHKFTSQDGTTTGQFLTGPSTGQTFTTVGIPEFTGHIELGAQTLIASILTPGVETETTSGGATLIRICHRSRVYTKI